MVGRRFIATVLTLVVIAITTFFVILLAKGYRISPQKGTITGTGIISVTSIPDQASVYLDNHLTTATNSNINSLSPKDYTVKIVKDGYIPWEKKVAVKEGLVTEIKATLYRAIPSIYPLTYSGVSNVVTSPDGLKMVYFVPDSDEPSIIAQKKSGIWVWPMADRSIAFGRGNEPRQIGLSNGLDFSKADFRWSPDSTQLLASFSDRYLLFDADKFNDPPRDITAVLQATIKSWDDQDKSRRLTRLQSIKDFALRKEASNSAILKWSPDETKILMSTDGTDFKVVDLTDRKKYDLPKITNVEKTDQTQVENPTSLQRLAPYSWLADSEHLVLVENLESQSNNNKATQTTQPKGTTFPLTKISIIEIDGFNKSEIYVGNLDSKTVIVWPDGSRLATVSTLPIPTASKPNLYGINLK